MQNDGSTNPDLNNLINLKKWRNEQSKNSATIGGKTKNEINVHLLSEQLLLTLTFNININRLNQNLNYVVI